MRRLIDRRVPRAGIRPLGASPYPMTWKDESNVTPWMVALTVKVPVFEVPPMVQDTEHAPDVVVVHAKSLVVAPDA